MRKLLKVLRKGWKKRVSGERNLGVARKRKTNRRERVAEAEKKPCEVCVDQQREKKRWGWDAGAVPRRAWHWIPLTDRRCDSATRNRRADHARSASIPVTAIRSEIRTRVPSGPSGPAQAFLRSAACRARRVAGSPIFVLRPVLCLRKWQASRASRMRGYRARDNRQPRRPDSVLG